MNDMTIFGAGAIGSNLAVNLLLARPGLYLTVIDRDTVERRNLSIQPYTFDQIGSAKVEALELHLFDKIGELTGRLQGVQLNVIGKVSLSQFKSNLWIDAFDNAESRNLLRRKAYLLGVPVVSLGFSPEMMATVLWDTAFPYEMTSTEGTLDVCDLGTMRYWIHGVVGIMTAKVLTFLEERKKISCLITKNFEMRDF